MADDSRPVSRAHIFSAIHAKVTRKQKFYSEMDWESIIDYFAEE